MNGRIKEEDTPEGRLAAVARTVRLMVARKYHEGGGRAFPAPEPDYADYMEAFQPFMKREELVVRIDQARKDSAKDLTDTVRLLAIELRKAEAECDRRLKEVFGN